MMEAVKKRAHAIISGKVQGVFFRVETQKAAQEIGVTGWVRNKADGTVEAVFEGDESSVASALEWCRKGSPRSEVSHIDVTWEEAGGEFTDFEITY